MTVDRDEDNREYGREQKGVADSEAAESAEPDAPGDMPNANDLLGHLFEEKSLWPLLSVLLASLGALGAGLLVLALVDRNPFAAAALLLLAGMTADVMIRSRRKSGTRSIAKLLGMLWGAAAALALIAWASGIV